MVDIKNIFIEHASMYDKATNQGNYKLVNKLHAKLTILYQKIKNDGKWNILYELINHPNESVRL